MMNAVLASNNAKKIKELRELLAGLPIGVLSLAEAGYEADIPETGASFEENSLIKASVAAGLGCIGLADDSGLAVDCLNGAPGIYSARYAGEHGNDEKNRAKLLSAMADVEDENRGARFVCVVSVVLPEKSALVIPEPYRISQALAEKVGLSPEKAAVLRGECEGRILREERGAGGFGYDSLFWYPPFGKTFAEADGAEKNAVSHRGNAMRKLAVLLARLTSEQEA